MLEKLFLAVVIIAAIFGVLAVTANDPQVAEKLRLRNLFDKLGISQTDVHKTVSPGESPDDLTSFEKYQQNLAHMTGQYEQNLAQVRDFIENTRERLNHLMESYQNQIAPRQTAAGSLPFAPSLEKQAELTQQTQNDVMALVENFQDQAERLVNRKEAMNLMPAQLQERQKTITAQIDAHLNSVRLQAEDTQKQLDDFMQRLHDQADLLAQNRRNLLGAANKLQDRTTELTDQIEAKNRALREKMLDTERRLAVMKENLQDQITALMSQRRALDSIQLREQQQALAAQAKSLVQKTREDNEFQRTRREFLKDQLEDQQRRIREKIEDQTSR